jgi:glycosyltransferase 2 family protein
VKARAVLAAALGVALFAWLLWRAGLGAVSASIRTLGAGGFLGLIVFQLALALLAGAAWALLGRGRTGAGAGAFIRARLVREASSQALPFTQIGGVALGGRALALEGVSGAFATASTITDMAVEFTTQVAYAALGAFLLQALRPANPLARPVLGVVTGLAVMAAGLIWAQAHGASLVERGLRRFSGGDAREPGGVVAAFKDMRRRPGTLALAGVLHFAAWVLTGVQTWATLRVLHVGGVSLAGALVMDSLTSGARAVAFLVPGAFGVQEGALVLLGQVFGAPPAASLAVSLIRRGRDLALAVPILLLWQARQGRRIWTLGRLRLAPPAFTGMMAPGGSRRRGESQDG